LRRCLLDTAVFVYADGGEHPYREPCMNVLRWAEEGVISATASVELLQEYASVKLRRRNADRQRVARQARRIADVCELHDFERRDVPLMLDLLERHERLDARDALFAATALNNGIDAIVATDRAFDDVPGLERIDPADSTALVTLTNGRLRRR